MSEEITRRKLSPDLFEDAKEIFEELSAEDLVPSIIKKINELVDRELKSSLREIPSISVKEGIATKACERHVTLRTDTIRLIFESFGKNFKRNEFNELLRNAGRQMGTTFIRDLIVFLKKYNKCPARYEKLLDFWTLFDTSAGMGTFMIDEFNPEEGNLKIKIKDNFLLAKTTKDPHEYCRFSEGYIEGIISGGYLYYYDWLTNETRFTFDDKLLEVFDIQEIEKKENECLFAVKLRKRQLLEAEELLLEAYKAYTKGDLNQACLKARSALEFGIKIKIGIKPKHPISFFKILNSFEKAGIEIPKETKRLFNVASTIAHGFDADPIQSYEILNSAQNFISHIKLIDIPQDTRESISNSIYKEIEKKEYYVLIFGPGERHKEYDRRVGIREQITNLGYGAVFPEDFKSDNEFDEWVRSRGMELSDEEKSFLSNVDAKESIIAERCDLLLILLMSDGAISEFSQFYLDGRVAHKIRVLIPEKYYRSDSYLNVAPIKTFESKFKHVYPFKDRDDLKDKVKHILSAEAAYEYLRKRRQ